MNTTEQLSPREINAINKEKKQKACEEEFKFRRRAFVKIIDARGWEGKVGRIKQYCDERTDKHPNVKVEIEVVFAPGQGATAYSFYPRNLELTHEPASWSK